jgi:hypothetical protein
MAVTPEQQQQMLEAANPLIKWMAENVNPHCKAIVENNNVELLEGIATQGTDEFLKDCAP